MDIDYESIVDQKVVSHTAFCEYIAIRNDQDIISKIS
jgi:hypothetical protein